MVGAGINTTQTAGLALANDLAPPHVRPRVVALLFTMLLLGMVASAVVFSFVLKTFNPMRLIQLIQGVALATFVFNGIALWQQEPRVRGGNPVTEREMSFTQAWQSLGAIDGFKRLLLTVAVGTAAFNMQDILLEPFGGQIFGLPVGQTTLLMAVLAGGMLLGFFFAERLLNRQLLALRVAALGLVVGILSFSLVIFSPLIDSLEIFRLGAAGVGIGAGMFSVGSLTATMNLSQGRMSGILLGTWGGVQATAAGVAIAFSGVMRDVIGALWRNGLLGPAIDGPAAGYIFVFLLEIALLFATLIAVGPLVGAGTKRRSRHPASHLESVARTDGLKEA
jgi:BCD family chlorophyll transporter-like MFS transporter